MRKLLNDHYPLILYLVFFAVIFSIKIIQHPFPFFDWDESIYAQVGREMMQEKSYAVPLWQGRDWLDKPPLVPLFYGAVMILTPGIQPEISTRLATLYLSVAALVLMYALYYKVLKETWLTTLVIVITSLTPIFLQRAQVLNVDVFLLVGWLGYILFYRRFWLSLLFIFFAVYSKSLIGFYPMGIMFLYFGYQALTKEIAWREFGKEILRMTGQAAILLIWHAVMTARYGYDFLYKHFYESHVKRVTASIESHFGQRTFYIDLLYQQYGQYIFASIFGFLLIVWQWIRKSLNNTKLLHSFFLFPWFLFLNLTKTKIFWYGHPYLGQFAYLMVYPITLLRKVGLFYYGVIVVSMSLVLQYHFLKANVLDDFYSSTDPHHVIALEASKTCTELNMVITPEGRVASQTLEDLGLLISTSRWWGNHPSVVYYFEGDVNFVYTVVELEERIKISSKGTCFAISTSDPEGTLAAQSLTPVTSERGLMLYETTK